MRPRGAAENMPAAKAGSQMICVMTARFLNMVLGIESGNKSTLRIGIKKGEIIMEYTPMEKDVLSLMERTDFKNLSKNDVISFASKLGELRPEVAKELLAHYPEFVDLMKSALTEYKSMLDSIIKSDDESLKGYYSISEKEMDSATDSRKQFYDFVKQVQSDCSKCLENPNLPPEMVMEILNREIELAKMADEKDKEIRDQEREIEDKVNKKDTEKREFNWKLVSGISFAIATVAGVSAGVLGGKFDIKLPKKS